MKIIYKFSTILFALALLMTSCEDDRIMFDTSTKVVGFTAASIIVPENVPAGKPIELYLGAVLGTEPVTVNLTIVTEGHTRPAIEGVDFTISSKVVNLEVGKATVTINPIDNSEFEGNKTFNVKMTSSDPSISIANQNSVLVTIEDDEHPLKDFIGTYDVAAASYGKPGDWDESWVVTTTPDPSDVNKLFVTGVGTGTKSGSITAVLDLVDMTITIASGQTITAYGYTIGVKLGDADSNVIPDTPLTGTIQANGTIMVDFWANQITAGDYAGYVWDVFNTTWTKR
jgi:hypothetical protein